MKSAFQRVFLARSAVGVCTAILALLTIQPATGSDAPLHIAVSAARTPSSKPHHSSHFRAPHALLSGLASWYGQVFDGHTTANGEVFDKHAMTACHRTLPFGTLVRVINLRNRESVVVRINDRGTLRPDRVIDLSSAAAEKIGLLEAGLVPVKLEIVSRDRS